MKMSCMVLRVVFVRRTQAIWKVYGFWDLQKLNTFKVLYRKLIFELHRCFPEPFRRVRNRKTKKLQGSPGYSSPRTAVNGQKIS
ncbi:hypothetical protein NDU88_005196 [Pleurodeles waltl]|uniref:Uncharacterized protein n=1 Tax=Pleurodeles waltl TaxID=8319 RepID=A0AAV7RHT9_PLEWA|nr:hypothetical protein NDU88_005196 [Pleurodeles waltl]